MTGSCFIRLSPHLAAFEGVPFLIPSATYNGFREDGCVTQLGHNDVGALKAP